MPPAKSVKISQKQRSWCMIRFLYPVFHTSLKVFYLPTYNWQIDGACAVGLNPLISFETADQHQNHLGTLPASAMEIHT